MKRLTNNYNNQSLINSIILLILGIILFFNPGGVVKFVSYIVGFILIITGILNLLSFYKTKKNLNIEITSKLISGIILIILGLITITFANAIDGLIRLIIGILIIYSGIARLINLNTTSIIISIITIVLGLYIIFNTNLVFSMIGLCISIYSIINLILLIKIDKN